MSTTPNLGLPPRVRACLFDLDGVLTETARVHSAAWKEMFDAYLKARAERNGEPFVAFDKEADYGTYVDVTRSWSATMDVNREIYGGTKMWRRAGKIAAGIAPNDVICPGLPLLDLTRRLRHTPRPARSRGDSDDRCCRRRSAGPAACVERQAWLRLSRVVASNGMSLCTAGEQRIVR